MNPQQLICFLLFYLSLLILGFALAKKSWIVLLWVTALIAPFATFYILQNALPLMKMFGLITATLLVMKAVVTGIYYKGRLWRFNFFRWVAYAIGWVGMRPQLFETFPGNALNGSAEFIKKGIVNIGVGTGIIVLAHFAILLPLGVLIVHIMCSTMVLIGFSLILHFGWLNIMTGVWRLFGADTYTLFRQPLRSTSLAEFWGRRWNLAFIEMLSIAVLKPLKNKLGKRTAVMLSFLISGLLHELAISVPVGAGFGGPTLYFFIHGCALMAEQKLENKTLFFKGRVLVGRVWTFFWLTIPAPLLFHPIFLKNIVWPLAGLQW